MTPGTRQGLGASGRIRSSAEFRRISSRGRRKHTPDFLVIISPAATEQSRLGLSVGKRVGNAVVRNKTKRKIREYFRLVRNSFDTPRDVIVIAKPGAARLDYKSISEQLEVILKWQKKPC